MSEPELPLEQEIQRIEQTFAALPDSAEDRAATRRAQRWAGAALVACVVALAVLWSLTPLRHWLGIENLATAGAALADSPWAWPAIVGVFVLGGLLAFPVNLLSAATVLALGPLQGALCALLGACVSAAVLYEIGARLARERLRALAGARLLRVAEYVARRGLLAVIVLRVVPLAPYSLVCLVAGAAAIRRRDYLLGTALGMAPGIGLAALLIDRVLAAWRHPDAASVALLAAVAALVGAAAWALHRHLRRVLGESAA